MTRTLRQNRAALLGLLMAIAAVIGVYRILTTVIIVKDGVFYIEQARILGGEISGKLLRQPLGYPFLILCTHRVFAPSDGGVASWIYSAQAVALAARLLCVLPVYFIGKRFVGPRGALAGVLVLIVLPKPTEFGTDAMRDWPSLALLLTGLLLLLIAAEKPRLWLYALAGLACGAGSLVRIEALQLVFYGWVWLGWQTVRARNWPARARCAAAALVLALTAGGVQAAYIAGRGGLLPHRVHTFLRDISLGASGPATLGQAGLAFVDDDTLLGRLRLISSKTGRNLHEAFLPFWLVGLVCCLRKRWRVGGKSLIVLFVVTNVALVLTRSYVSQGATPDVHTRYLTPLVVGTIFFVPLGLRVVGLWVERLARRKRLAAVCRLHRRVHSRTILLAVAVAICVPKLLEPTAVDKGYLRTAADWLAANTPADARIIATDARVCFYAGRGIALLATLEQVQTRPDLLRADYLVVGFESGVAPGAAGAWRPVQEVPGRRSHRIVIFRPARVSASGGR